MIFNSIKRLLFGDFSQEKEEISLDFTGSIEFTLRIESLVIGHLKTENNCWTFEYSDDFRKQDTYRRLVGFSDLNRVYKSEVLWPFFKIRIPGLKQPMIQEIIESEGLDITNEAQLLERFGERTMANPYVLETYK